MSIEIREYKEEELLELIRIWNQVVKEGIAFPQEECLTDIMRIFVRIIGNCNMLPFCKRGIVR